MSIFNPCFLLSKNLIFLLLGIFGIGFIIGFHELGHFLFSKLFKINVPSFSIGFGPKLYQKKFGSTKFSLGAIPLGGYIESDKDSFESKPYYQKMMVIFGGIAFNLFFAYFVFCLLFIVGIPKTHFLYPINTSPIVESVSKEAETLGITPGDKIIAINDKDIMDETSIIFRQLRKSEAKNTTLKILRDEEIVQLELPKEELIKAFGTLKIKFRYSSKKGLPLFAAIKKGIQFTNGYIYLTLFMFKKIFTKRDVSGVGGPIMIIAATVKSASEGIKVFLILLALISVSLAVLNLIPLPILDGGQALLYTIEAIIRRPLSEKGKEYIFIASWILMLSLFVLVSFRDIWRLTAPYLTTIKKLFGN